MRLSMYRPARRALYSNRIKVKGDGYATSIEFDKQIADYAGTVREKRGECGAVGENLFISKLLPQEILIKGKIENIGIDYE